MTHHRAQGFALVVIGIAWITITNHGGRTSLLGLATGGLLILAGLVRVFRARRESPPAA